MICDCEPVRFVPNMDKCFFFYSLGDVPDDDIVFSFRTFRKADDGDVVPVLF